jgi:hypothetical protein
MGTHSHLLQRMYRMVFEDIPLQRIVERNTSAGGRRIATGTYTLTDAPGGGTRVRFTYAWQTAPFIERFLGGIVRSVMRRGFEMTMRRLAEQLEQQRGHGLRANYQL